MMGTWVKGRLAPFSTTLEKLPSLIEKNSEKYIEKLRITWEDIISYFVQFPGFGIKPYRNHNLISKDQLCVKASNGRTKFVSDEAKTVTKLLSSQFNLVRTKLIFYIPYSLYSHASEGSSTPVEVRQNKSPLIGKLVYD